MHLVCFWGNACQVEFPSRKRFCGGHHEEVIRERSIINKRRRATARGRRYNEAPQPRSRAAADRQARRIATAADWQVRRYAAADWQARPNDPVPV